MQVQPTPDGEGMEIHFCGCRNMTDLAGVLDLCDIEGESHLLPHLACEYRRAGLFVGVVREFLDRNALMARLGRIGRPVEFVGGGPSRLDGALVVPDREFEAMTV